ncbi:KAP family P-loop NTPase fold protein [Pannonibacter phragmitetus]|uniref:KAP NTPase domain-containing protein n=1 Tax=Pannonibacter phragmitetus TaxID=121719 RepID=A0A0U3MWR2_9HYPH|nr:P-loop NTPase fold protein [Pannonibacter phragmitetus]ALV28775.1 hypothetical protein APZ00_18370 [Pannonibacter phragmitetus]
MKIDEDRPLDNAESDEYGFAPIAAKLSKSISGLAESEGVVFGIEGAWGAGKTSFLNLLKTSLASESNLKVLSISPWLIGDARSLVAVLGDLLIPILEVAENYKSHGKKSWAFWRKKKVVTTAELVRGYAARTSRGLAPIAKLAGIFLPGASIVGEAMEHSANALKGISLKQSDESLKAEIVKRIVASNLRFVVVIDDLDRLEPPQVTEVMRLVRSVADFPCFAYVLCYDREILAQALETGLSIKDGDLYMQKIVQLTFALPQPEPFDLRIALRRNCITLFKKVRGHEPSDEEAHDIGVAIDREGSRLRTPRDVKLVLNGLNFIYPTIAEEIYFPDLCRVHLLKALQPKLYHWVEQYLGVQSAVVSGDASVSKSEKGRMGERLGQLLPDDDPSSTLSIWSLQRFVPGVEAAKDANKRVFQRVSSREISDFIIGKRLGSPLHHRFYFALSAPKALITPAQMEKIRSVAGTSPDELRAILIDYIEDDRSLSQSWFEHLVARLDDGELAQYTFEQLVGLILGFATTCDLAQVRLERRPAFMMTLTDKVGTLVDHAIRRLRVLDGAKTQIVLERLYREGDLSWLVGHFHRDSLFDHGLVGERPKPENARLLTSDEVEKFSEILHDRIKDCEPDLLSLPDFGSFIWGWRDLAGIDAVKAWIEAFASDDASFLSLLGHLRSWAVSDRVYYPLRRDAVENFFEYNAVLARLDAIGKQADDKTSVVVASLRDSLQSANNA